MLHRSERRPQEKVRRWHCGDVERVVRGKFGEDRGKTLQNHGKTSGYGPIPIDTIC